MATLEEALGLESETSEGRSLESALGVEPEQPSVLSRIGSGIEKGITGIGEFIEQAPGDILSAGQTLAELLTGGLGRPRGQERIKGALKGAASAASLGLYQPELEGEQAEAARGGRFAAGAAIGMGTSKLVGPLVKALGPVAGKVTEAAALSAPAAGAAAIQGEDPLEAFTAGMTQIGTAQALTGLSQRTAKVLTSPAKQAVEKEALNKSIEAQRYMDWQKRMDDIARQQQDNQAIVQGHQQAIADAQAKLASGAPGAIKQYHDALLALRSAEKQLKQIESSAVSQVQKLRPKMTPEEAYAEYNEARVTPETLPVLELKNTSATVSRLGGGLARATEDLPKAAGPAGTMEKLAVGLEEVAGGAEGKFRPEVVQSFGKSWASMPEAQKLKLNQKYVESLGITGDDVALVSSGKMRLDQADRILSLVGPNAGTNGIASKIYWSIMEDMRNSKDPMVQGLLRAKAVQRQDIAAGDIAQMLRPVADRFGRETINSASLKNLQTMFRNFDRDPRLLKWEERLLVESIPAAERPELLKFVGEIFKAREGVAELKALSTKSPKMKFREPKVSPEVAELREVPMEYTAPHVAGGRMEQLNYAIARAAGWNIPGAIIASRGFDAAMRLIFRAGMTERGRAMVRNLYRESSPNINDVGRLMALANFVRTMNEAEEQSQGAY